MKHYSGEPIMLLARSSIVFFLTTSGIPSAAPALTADSAPPQRISMEPDCDIRLIDPYNGKFESESPSNARYKKIPPPSPSSLEALEFSWICISKDDSRVGFHGIASFDPYAKKWVLDWSRIVGGAATKREEQWQYSWYRAQYKLIQLNAVNSNGYAIVDRAQTGDGAIPAESDKKAQDIGPVVLSFCLLHKTKAICGNGHVGQKHDGPKGDLTPYTLKIIHSIEFLD
ncbi:hypothetical protein [Variovorax sp. KBW07]|uniref:hypothetical protein n=1 Tax=Variovorax sp. KBW07 TaxID=2153358 RepID=UPI0011CF3BEE|nr:hypothetical protein [Variovorax sp. KBW07]